MTSFLVKFTVIALLVYFHIPEVAPQCTKAKRQKSCFENFPYLIDGINPGGHNTRVLGPRKCGEEDCSCAVSSYISKTAPDKLIRYFIGCSPFKCEVPSWLVFPKTEVSKGYLFDVWYLSCCNGEDCNNPHEIPLKAIVPLTMMKCQVGETIDGEGNLESKHCRLIMTEKPPFGCSTSTWKNANDQVVKNFACAYEKDAQYCTLNGDKSIERNRTGSQSNQLETFFCCSSRFDCNLGNPETTTKEPSKKETTTTKDNKNKQLKIVLAVVYSLIFGGIIIVVLLAVDVYKKQNQVAEMFSASTSSANNLP